MKLFRRTVENFDCIHCGAHTVGNGYTDHCSYCLYSLHVDIFPGDRKSDCHGIMVPINIITQGGDIRSIQYRCERCSYTHNSGFVEDDSFEAALEIIKKFVESQYKKP